MAPRAIEPSEIGLTRPKYPQGIKVFAKKYPGMRKLTSRQSSAQS